MKMKMKICVYKHRNTLPYSEMEKNMAHIKAHKHVPGKKREKKTLQNNVKLRYHLFFFSYKDQFL